jgi:surface antigen
MRIGPPIAAIAGAMLLAGAPTATASTRPIALRQPPTASAASAQRAGKLAGISLASYARDHRDANQRMTTTSPRSSSKLINPANAGSVTLPSVVSPAPVPSAAAVAAVAQWTSESLAAWQSGQCTELAFERRPDIVLKATEAWFDTQNAKGDLGQAPQPNWDATFWDANAAAAGIPVGTAPQANAIMVYHSHNWPAWPGHVAYVEQVNPDGSFVIEEEDAPVSGKVDQRTVYPSDLVGADVDFIY